jgi:hypothetical protein
MATKKPNDSIAKHVLSYWKGGEPLWAAFWIYGVFVGLLLEALFTLVFKRQMAGGYEGSLLDCWGIITLSIAATVYVVWNFVSVWRCAKNASKPWGTVARSVYVIAAVLCVWFWFAGPGREAMMTHHQEYYGTMGMEGSPFDFFPRRRIDE